MRSARRLRDHKMAYPLYERIRAEVLAEHATATHQSEDEVLASLEAKFAALIGHEKRRDHKIERQRLLAPSSPLADHEDASAGLGPSGLERRTGTD